MPRLISRFSGEFVARLSASPLHNHAHTHTRARISAFFRYPPARSITHVTCSICCCCCLFTFKPVPTSPPTTSLCMSVLFQLLSLIQPNVPLPPHVCRCPSSLVSSAFTVTIDKVDLRETISLMQSHGEVKQEHPFPQHRSTNSGRIAPCATGLPTGTSSSRSGTFTGSISNDGVQKK